MAHWSHVNVIAPEDLDVSKVGEDARVYESKKQTRHCDISCQTCGLLCRQNIKPLPEYIQSNKAAEKAEDVCKNGMAFSQMHPKNDKGAMPPVTECVKVASENVRRLCCLFARGSLSDAESRKYGDLVAAVLCTSPKRQLYCDWLGDFELALVHIIQFSPDVIKKVWDSGNDRIVWATILDPELDKIIAKHRRIRDGMQDLALKQRQEDVKRLVSSLIGHYLPSFKRGKTQELCDSFLYPKLLNFEKYADFSNEVIASALFCLASTFADVGDANVNMIAEHFLVLPGAIASVRVRMGEDLNSKS